MTQPGETLGFTASDHVQALYDHLEKPFLDMILVNNEPVPQELKYRYEEEQAQPVVFDIERLEKVGLQVIADEIISYDSGLVRHDTERLSEIIYSLL